MEIQNKSYEGSGIQSNRQGIQGKNATIKREKQNKEISLYQQGDMIQRGNEHVMTTSFMFGIQVWW